MSTSAMNGETLVRVEKGNPTEAELAALATVLLARAAAAGDGASAGPDAAARATARWHRLERSAAHRPPRSWQGGAGRRGAGA
ncbi:acyl-CoA carboxylase epsilon subunit [Streptomyces sp. NPDC006711]|uniref:acyl-CoA carboxylase epsilon subunit n=1 Tax=unclassified Streptomyces TaxID=2593676 RepID=UPI0033EC9F51